MAFAPVWLKETSLLTVAHKRETEWRKWEEGRMKRRDRGQERDRERCLDCKRRFGYHSLQDSNSCSFSYKRKRRDLWGRWRTVGGWWQGVSDNHVCNITSLWQCAVNPVEETSIIVRYVLKHGCWFELVVCWSWAGASCFGPAYNQLRTSLKLNQLMTSYHLKPAAMLQNIPNQHMLGFFQQGRKFLNNEECVYLFFWWKWVVFVSKKMQPQL